MLVWEIATRRVRVAVKAEEIVDTECCCWEKMAVSNNDIGTIPIRART